MRNKCGASLKDVLEYKEVGNHYSDSEFFDRADTLMMSNIDMKSKIKVLKKINSVMGVEDEPETEREVRIYMAS